MELLDATIALAVTLAALATTVTVIMEIVVRYFGLKSKGQIELFKEIFDQSFKNRFSGQASDFEFVHNILGNPLTPWRATPKPATDAKNLQRNLLKNPTYRDLIGGKSLGVYDWVSTEHVFRHLLALPGVIDDGRAQLIQKLKEFNVEYDQLCAAAKTQFKNNRHTWSVLIGLMLALVLNVNALRIFEAFLANPTLTAATVAAMDNLADQSRIAEEKYAEAIEDADSRNIDEVNKSIAELQRQLGDLQTMGIPIGWGYTPHCQLADTLTGIFSKPEDPVASSCLPEPGVSGKEAQARSTDGFVSGAASLITSLLTGLLIGLGAPFWFDLAKRLSAVRSSFQGKVSSEDTYNGETPKTGSPEDKSNTDKLISRLVEEALTSGKVVGTRKLLTPGREI